MKYLNITIMKKRIFRITLFLFFSLFISTAASAQWWNLYGPGSLQETIETDNGDLVAGGTAINLVNGVSEGLILRTDADGNELWRLTFPDSVFTSYVSNIVEANNGDLLFSYLHYTSILSPLYSVYRITANGDIIWVKSIEELSNTGISAFFENPVTGNLLISSNRFANPQFSDSMSNQIILLDDTGNLIQEKIYLGDPICCSNRFQAQLVPIPDGYIMALGDSIYRLDNTLNEIWTRSSPGEEARDLIQSEQGDFICATVYSYDFGGTDATIFRFDESGTITWDTSFFLIPAGFIKIFEKSNQEIKVFYKKVGNGANDVNSRTVSSTGNLGAEEILPQTFWDSKDVSQTDNDDLVFMGSANAFPANVRTAFLLRTDCEISGFNNILTGKIYVDETFDCIYDSTEQLLPNYPIQLVHQNGIVYYGMSDSTGQYEINVSSGSYQTSAIPQSLYEIPCTPQIVNFFISDTTIFADLPIQRIIECPQMSVSVGVPFLFDVVLKIPIQ